MYEQKNEGHISEEDIPAGGVRDCHAGSNPGAGLKEMWPSFFVPFIQS